jgi:ABC-type multidrug transport system ATPase subunit
MSESILNALVQLFALIARTSGTSSKNNVYLDSLLKQHLSPRLFIQYKELYSNYIDRFAVDVPINTSNFEESKESVKQHSEKVCSQIRKELPAPERIIVIVKFLEFVKDDNKINDLEEVAIDTIFKGFLIDPTEANNLKDFILYSNLSAIDGGKMVIFGKRHSLANANNDQSNIIEFNVIDDKSKIDGNLYFLYLNSVCFFVVKYIGKTELYLDGMPLISGKTEIFDVGSSIRGANMDPIFYSSISSIVRSNFQQQKIIFSAENLEFHFRNSSNGIQPFSFSEESGQLIGIMGGSGVGKSTLLNILTGKQRPDSGWIFINGHDIYLEKHTVQGLIGYVPQDDLLFENLTVYQNLYYNAKLCFGNFSNAKIGQVVKRVLYDLDLWDIRDLKVGTPLNKMISGGQRKRLNFGLEFMREPSILFVDEPTSGLSSSDSLMVMKLLKQQAHNGRLVIANIHQPSSKIFRLLDKLWVLDKGGHPIYSGNPTDALVYFKTLSTQVNASESGCPHCGTVNPEQILELVEAKQVDAEGRITIARKKSPDEWYSHYKNRIQNKVNLRTGRSPLPKSYFNIPNVDVQFKVFSIRNLLSKLSNHQYLFINLFEAPLLAFVLAFFSKHVPGNEYIFADNKNFPAYLLMSIVVALFIGLTVSAEEIINDRKILERERFLNLSRFSYLNAKILYLFGLSAFQMLLFVLVGNSILEIHGMTLSFWLILFSTACFANMVGLNLSAGLGSVVAIYISIPFVLVPQILLSGTIVQFDNLHPSITRKVYVPVVGDFMASRWAYEALAVEQFKNNAFEKHFFILEQESSNANFRTSFLIPRLQGIIDESVRIIALKDPEYSRLERNVGLIKNEFSKFAQNDSLPPFEFLDRLNARNFSEDLAEELKAYLIFVRMHFTSRGNVAREKKDSIYNKLVDSLGSDAVFALRMRNYNKALANWALNSSEVNKYLETSDEVIPKYEPIFMMPMHSWGRSQFYAPFKKFNNQYVYTLWFNLAVIWLGILLLFGALQANLLWKLLAYFGHRRTSKKLRKAN